jgi:hypothetical protein
MDIGDSLNPAVDIGQIEGAFLQVPLFELLDNREMVTHMKKFSKFFLKMISIGIKTCGKFEFDIYEAKNASLIQGRPIY